MSLTFSQTKWSTLPLGDIAAIERDAIAPEDIRSGTKYVGLENVTNEGQFSEVSEVSNGELASTKFRFTPKHILYGKLRPYLSKIARPDFEGVCSTDILPILPGNRVNRDFLYYFLRLPEMVSLAASRSIGANLPRLSPRQLAEFEIPLPPLPEQKRIADILDKADAIRRKRREATDVARAFEEALFFQKFLATRLNLPILALGDICLVIRDGVHKTPTYVTEGIPFLTVKNLTALPDRISFDECKFITPEDHAEFSKRTNPEVGDVLVSKDGTIGVAKEITDGLPFNIFVSVALLKLRRDVIHSTFLKTQFNMPFVQRQIADSVKGVAIRHLHLADFKRLSIVVPPMSAQLDFVNHVSRVQSTESLQAQARTQADELYYSLVQRAFRGEL